jgi:pyruvate,orthophosphate dikinase
MRWVYRFGGKRADGSAELKDILGGKGANLAEMTNLGIPVPPGFTISAALCTRYLEANDYPSELEAEVREGIRYVEKVVGRRFGAPDNPLLVSVRSGARASMPGMMDTILNLGLNDETVKGLIKSTGDERFAYDCHRRFVEMFGDVVLGVGRSRFEERLEQVRSQEKVEFDYELSPATLARLVCEFKEIISQAKGVEFPEAPDAQLWAAIGAVFSSWNTPRAKEYRRLYKIPEDWGTAVNIQAMVVGNRGQDSLTGVGFTRNPATGEPGVYGEYLPNAQGEDVVAGVRTPRPIAELSSMMPRVYEELSSVFKRLEHHYKDIQDVEFTVEQGRLWILQTRTGKRTPQASVRIAVDMAKEGLISKEEALLRVSPEEVDQLLHPQLDPRVSYTPLARGLPASPGAASGRVVFTAEAAVKMSEDGASMILIRHQTSADDVAGMARAKGFLTATGGMTSHAAVVARGMGKPCVVGCEVVKIDYERREFAVGETVVKEGDVITVDGTKGEVILGEVPTIEPGLSEELSALLIWADEFRRLGVRANADLPSDARRAREFGAQGIGLCRTEHMFFGKDRIGAMREMILARDEAGRRKALSRLLPMQREDFKGLFREMAGLPVIIRTLDPPLHEFLPETEEATAELSQELGIPCATIRALSARLHEQNPMLGHRGCRLGITYPEITEMQARAIFEAACEVAKEGVRGIPEVMIPVVSHAREFTLQRQIVDRVAKEVFAQYGFELKYLVGTMIELPRAALTADEIAKEAEFFSYGTNDLTQTTMGFSRDDAVKFLPDYIDQGILKDDPFQVLDTQGVGELIMLGLERGRRSRPRLEVGICGEHGGDPRSIEFCEAVGLDYVSCSPYRVPIARLAAAQARIKRGRD